MKGNKQLVKSEQPHNSLIAAWLARRYIINIIKITLFIFYFIAVDPQTINIVQHRVFFRKTNFFSFKCKTYHEIQYLKSIPSGLLSTL
jgi:hypothetical protein